MHSDNMVGDKFYLASFSIGYESTTQILATKSRVLEVTWLARRNPNVPECARGWTCEFFDFFILKNKLVR